MSEPGKRKGGGGWQKLKAKKKALMEIEAKKCQKLTNIFITPGPSSSSTDDIVPANTSTSFISAVDNNILLHGSEERCKSTDVFEDKDSDKETNEDDKKLVQVEDQCEEIQDFEEDVSKYFTKPNLELLPKFLDYHPIQPILEQKYSLNGKKAYFRKDGIRRSWLSLNVKTDKLFCSFCLAFNKVANESVFITGYDIKRAKHIYQRISEHESSLFHMNCTEAYILKVNDKDVYSLYKKKSSENVDKNRQILDRIIETIKLIGKRGLSYRGTQESAYTLLDENIDHGNFLELLLLISKYDPLLKLHIEECIKKSTERHNKSEGRKGRGNLITFLSKTTANSIIDIIGSLMKQMISDEIKNAQMYSIQIDTSQDINVQDQCSIVIRYVTDSVQERLISIVNCSSTTGKSLFELVCNVFEKCNIDIAKCVGNSTDGAANMQGQYKGFSTWLNNVAPGQTHTWCYAHILNLVISDITQLTPEVITLFGVLNTCATFLRESYLRFNVWRDFSKLKFISVIGETRWWSKDRALKKMFGQFNSTTGIIFYADVLQTFYEISQSQKFNSEVRYKANTLLDSLKRFETIITAQIFLNIFESTTALSLYLQTNGMNLMCAMRMVTATLESLNNDSRKFDTVLQAAEKFVQAVSKELDERNLDIIIQDKFKEKRKKNEKERYKIEVYNVIMDTVISSLSSRFSKNNNLCKELCYLDPCNFSELTRRGVPSDYFQNLETNLKRFDQKITKEQLQTELIDFAKKWNNINKTLIEEFSLNYEHDHEVESPEEEIFDKNHCMKYKPCKNCVICCFNVLEKYNLHSLAYSKLYLAYKYVLTLSITQVSCERSFSKLKFILNRLRNCLSQSHLETFMIMNCEKDILLRIKNEDIINLLAEKSKSKSI